MRKLFVLLIVMVMVGILSGGAFAMEHEKDAKMAGKEMESTWYTCPMHPEVKATWEGECPKCGMKLEAMKHEKKDDCPACAMKAMERKLNLTEEQKEEMKKLKEECWPKMKEVLTEEQIEKMKKMKEDKKDGCPICAMKAMECDLNLTEDQKEEMKMVKEECWTKMKGILTEEQIEKMKEMKKEKGEEEDGHMHRGTMKDKMEGMKEDAKKKMGEMKEAVKEEM